MGSLNVAETCELIGLYLLHELKIAADKNDIDCFINCIRQKKKTKNRKLIIISFTNIYFGIG